MRRAVLLEFLETTECFLSTWQLYQGLREHMSEQGLASG
jgi:hypothetical protein